MEFTMSAKKFIKFFILSALILASFASTGTAAAWSSCGTSYIVQSGDTLGAIANRCGTSIAAIQLANPNLGYWVYAGQTL
jgi:LysM repeat protein